MELKAKVRKIDPREKLLYLLLFFPIAFSFFGKNSRDSLGTEDDVGVVADANNDGVVDGIDYVVWLVNFGKETSKGKGEGDFDLNGKVDKADYNVWLSSYRISPTPTSTPTPTEGQPTSTPSPTLVPSPSVTPPTFSEEESLLESTLETPSVVPEVTSE